MSKRPEFDWLFGNIFDERLKVEARNRDVTWSQLLRTFQSNPTVERTWAEYINAYRNKLVNPDEAPSKAKQDISVAAQDFDGELLDALSECMTCAKLEPFGFGSFRVIVPPADRKRQPTTPDFLAIRDDKDAAIEVKNLRAHECVEAVMPDIFNDDKLKGLDLSGISLVVLRSFRGTLNKEEKQRLKVIIQNLRSYPLNQVCREHLSERAEAAFKVIPGNGTAMCQDFIRPSDLARDVDAYTGLLNKIGLNARKALKQLHSTVATSAQVRVVAMRWDIPFVSIPWPATLTNEVLAIFANAQRDLGLKADLHIFTDHDYVLASTLQQD